MSQVIHQFTTLNAELPDLGGTNITYNEGRLLMAAHEAQPQVAELKTC